MLPDVCASFELESHPSVAVYTPALLAVYDTLVLGLNSRLLWRCPKRRGVEFYNRHVGARHLDIGVGSGYFLDRCRFPVPDPQITLLDLSAVCLAHVARRLARYSPETRRASVLDETLDLGEARFDSIALSGVLPCLPATMNQKTAALSRLRPYLADNGVLFGSTILGRGVRHNGLARRVIAAYNRRGIFTNLDDDLEGLEQGLAAGFADVDIQIEGSATMFTARP